MMGGAEEVDEGFRASREAVENLRKIDVTRCKDVDIIRRRVLFLVLDCIEMLAPEQFKKQILNGDCAKFITTDENMHVLFQSFQYVLKENGFLMEITHKETKDVETAPVKLSERVKLLEIMRLKAVNILQRWKHLEHMDSPSRPTHLELRSDPVEDLYGRIKYLIKVKHAEDLKEKDAQAKLISEKDKGSSDADAYCQIS